MKRESQTLGCQQEMANVITEKLIVKAYNVWLQRNPEGTLEQFAKEISETVGLILNAEKPEDLMEKNKC